jgi:hypothetical protein
MEIVISSNMGELAARINAKRSQIPYAASRALNDIAFEVRNEIVRKTYPRSFNVKNTRFPGVLFRVEKSTKRNLKATIFDRIAREGKSNSEYLARQESGGIKTSRSSSNVAIPSRFLMPKRNSQGRVPNNLRPRNLLNDKNAFKVKTKKGAELIMRRDGRTGKAKVYYVLSQSARITKRFPFYKDAETVIRKSWNSAFSKYLEIAMKTAR